MDRQVTPPKRVTSPPWGPRPPCKQALRLANSNFARASRINVHFFVIVARLQRETSYFHVLWRT